MKKRTASGAALALTLWASGCLEPGSSCVSAYGGAGSCLSASRASPPPPYARAETASNPAAEAFIAPLATKDLLHRRFALVRVDGKDFTAAGRAERPDIEFNEGFQITGRVCNRFRGPAELRDGQLRTQLVMTRMMCANPEWMELEQLFHAMLREGADISLSEDGFLTLRGGGHALVYERADWVR